MKATDIDLSPEFRAQVLANVQDLARQAAEVDRAQWQPMPGAHVPPRPIPPSPPSPREQGNGGRR